MRSCLTVALALTLVSAIHAQELGAEDGVATLPLQAASAPVATPNLMDRIRAINNNIGRAIPINTIPAELASGNLTSIPRANGAADVEPTVDEAAQGIPDAAVSTDEQTQEEMDESAEANAEAEGDGKGDGEGSEVEQITERLAVSAERRRRSPQGHNIGHAVHGAASHVRLGHALARNATQILQEQRHVNGRELCCGHPDRGSATKPRTGRVFRQIAAAQ